MYVIRGHGAVWGAREGRVIARFDKGGVFQTEDADLAARLHKAGYRVEGGEDVLTELSRKQAVEKRTEEKPVKKPTKKKKDAEKPPEDERHDG